MAAGGRAAYFERHPTPPRDGPPSVYRVEFWVIGGQTSPAGIPREWQLFNVRWADRWDQIPTLVQDWEALGGMWLHSQLRIEEYTRDADGRYSPANRL